MSGRESRLKIYELLRQREEVTLDSHSDLNIQKQSNPITMLNKKNPPEYTSQEFAEFFLQLVQKSQSDGLLSIDGDASQIDDDIMRKELELVIDGTEPNQIEEILKAKLEKDLYTYRTKYEAVIQLGHHPEIIRENLEAMLP